MRFFAVVLTVSVGLGCAETSSRQANSPDDESNEEVTEPQGEGADLPAEVDENSDEQKDQEDSRPAKKRKPKRRKHVEDAPEPEPAPLERATKPARRPVAPPPEEAPPASADGTAEGDDTLEAEARRRCRWKSVPPYRPEWANSISPPLAQQRKITSQPICSYGTPPAVLRAARQIAVQQSKMNRR